MARLMPILWLAVLMVGLAACKSTPPPAWPPRKGPAFPPEPAWTNLPEEVVYGSGM